MIFSIFHFIHLCYMHVYTDQNMHAGMDVCVHVCVCVNTHYFILTEGLLNQSLTDLNP